MDTGLVGGIVGGIANIGGMAYDIYNSERNFQEQQKMNDYMKDVQAQTWARDDNSIQRRVEDLKRAGLSPVLAAGTGASNSAPIKLAAPQVQESQGTRASENVSAAMTLMQQAQN